MLLLIELLFMKRHLNLDVRRRPFLSVDYFFENILSIVLKCSNQIVYVLCCFFLGISEEAETRARKK